MSHVDDETLRQSLTRVAASRVRVVDAVEAVRKGAQGCVHSFPVSATALKMAGVALGGLVLSGVLTAKLFGRKKKPKAIKPELRGQAVVLQAVSALLIPLLQRWLVSGGTARHSGGKESVQTSIGKSSALDFSALFYRWLGLQK